MSIVGGFDVHRRQITYDYLDTDTGQIYRGRIAPACRRTPREWLVRFAGRPDVAFAVEACTGWRFVVEELEQAGVTAALAEPADTARARGPKHRAKTDRTDARLLREPLARQRLPLSWIPPRQVREVRALLELYKDPRDEHTAWARRAHALLFHQGVEAAGLKLTTAEGRAALVDTEGGLSSTGRQTAAVMPRVMDLLQEELDTLARQLATHARRRPGCGALANQYGVGPVTATAIWAMLGDTRRFSSSRQAVRHAGLDVTVYSSDGKRGPGRLSKQGSPLLRWALYEAGYRAARTTAPDHAYYSEVKDRVGGNRAALSVARKIVRRSHHLPRELGDDAFAVA
jgi:transposase